MNTEQEADFQPLQSIIHYTQYGMNDGHLLQQRNMNEVSPNSLLKPSNENNSAMSKYMHERPQNLPKPIPKLRSFASSDAITDSNSNANINSTTVSNDSNIAKGGNDNADHVLIDILTKQQNMNNNKPLDSSVVDKVNKYTTHNPPYTQEISNTNLVSNNKSNNQDTSEQPFYVNAKQYYRILKRRYARAKLEENLRISRERKPYLHESRHKHAMRRPRGQGGRFLTAAEIEQLKQKEKERENAENTNVNAIETANTMEETFKQSETSPSSEKSEKSTESQK